MPHVTDLVLTTNDQKYYDVFEADSGIFSLTSWYNLQLTVKIAFSTANIYKVYKDMASLQFILIPMLSKALTRYLGMRYQLAKQVSANILRVDLRITATT